VWRWFFLNQLDAYKNNLYGIDYSKRAINFARLFTEGKPINYLISEWENLPFEDEYFDVVTSIAVLEHIKPLNVSLCIKETYRVLKNDGLFILAIPSKNLKKAKKHFQHFNIDYINKITDQYFEIENIYGRYNKLFPTFYKFFDNRFYEIRPLSKFVIKRLFYKYFASSFLS
jgi:ubiquinone/menaquinone biosynthesis C-methylase UbiE